MGTTGLSSIFQHQCHMINTITDHSKGIDVNPANLNMQKQNVIGAVFKLIIRCSPRLWPIMICYPRRFGD